MLTYFCMRLIWPQFIKTVILLLLGHLGIFKARVFLYHIDLSQKYLEQLVLLLGNGSPRFKHLDFSIYKLKHFCQGRSRLSCFLDLNLGLTRALIIGLGFKSWLVLLW